VIVSAQNDPFAATNITEVKSPVNVSFYTSLQLH